MATSKSPEWPTVKFGDAVRNVNTTTKDPESMGLDRVVGLDHMDPESLPLKRWDELIDLNEGTSFTRIFKSGQVLFGKRRAYQKKVSVPEFDGICSGDILVFEPSSETLLPDFLPYIVQSDGFFDHALGTSAGSLSPRTKWQELAKYEFVLPPVEEQAAIASLLSQASAVKAGLISSVQQTWETRNAILGNWIMGAGPSSGDVLGTVADVNPTSARLDKNSPFVTMDAVPILDRSPTYFELKGSRSGARAMASDVLFARITPCLENGKTCQVPNDIESCGGSTELLVIRTKGLVPQDLIFHWATSQRIRHMAEGRMSGSTGRQRLSSQDLARLPFPDPASFDAEILVRKLNELEALGKLLAKKLDSAQSLTRELREYFLRGHDV
jgi:type I restriction enzyme S subunit